MKMELFDFVNRLLTRVSERDRLSRDNRNQLLSFSGLWTSGETRKSSYSLMPLLDFNVFLFTLKC